MCNYADYMNEFRYLLAFVIRSYLVVDNEHMESHTFNMSSFSLSILLLFLWPQSHEYLSTRIRLLVFVANVTRKKVADKLAYSCLYQI